MKVPPHFTGLASLTHRYEHVGLKPGMIGCDSLSVSHVIVASDSCVLLLSFSETDSDVSFYERERPAKVSSMYMKEKESEMLRKSRSPGTMSLARQACTLYNTHLTYPPHTINGIAPVAVTTTVPRFLQNLLADLPSANSYTGPFASVDDVIEVRTCISIHI